MAMACPICRGSRVLICAEPQPLAVTVQSDAVGAPLDTGRRTYPCPACNRVPPYELLRVLTVASEPQEHRAEAARHIKRQQALSMADEMLRTGAVTFDERRTDQSTEYRSTAAVVSPSFVATMGQRLKERQTEFAEDVAALAIASINVWGSHYGETHISKMMARHFIREAIKTAAERRNSWGEWDGAPATGSPTTAAPSRSTEPASNPEKGAA